MILALVSDSSSNVILGYTSIFISSDLISIGDGSDTFATASYYSFLVLLNNFYFNSSAKCLMLSILFVMPFLIRFINGCFGRSFYKISRYLSS